MVATELNTNQSELALLAFHGYLLAGKGMLLIVFAHEQLRTASTSHSFETALLHVFEKVTIFDLFGAAVAIVLASQHQTF